MPDSESKIDRGGQKRSSSREGQLAALARQQFGVVSGDQLARLKFSGREIRGRVERGQLHKLHLGVYAVGHTRLVPHARLLAALLTCGPTSFLSHRTSAAVRGLRSINTSRIDVTVPGTRRRPRDRLVLHQSRPPHADDVTTYNGLRASSVPRLLIELAPDETLGELDRLITEAVRKRLLDLRLMEEALARHGHRPGLARLKQALRDYRPRHHGRSHLEDTFAELIDHPDVPPPLRNVIIGGWEVDFYWPHAKLVVELDGRPYHIAVRDIERDKLKDAKLLLLGISTMRVTDLRMTLEPTKVLEDVLRLTT